MVHFFQTFEEARTYRNIMNGGNGDAGIWTLYSRPPDQPASEANDWAVAEYRTDELDYENDLWEMVSLELEDILESNLRQEGPTGDEIDQGDDDHEPFWRRPDQRPEAEGNWS